MQRVESVVQQLFQEINRKLQLSAAQIQPVSELRLLLLRQITTKNKEEIYQDCTNYIYQKLVHVLTIHQCELLFQLMYSRYFDHYDLLQDCAKFGMNNKSEVHQQMKQLGRLVTLDLEQPYVATPLCEAVEIPIKKGIQLDPLYLD